MEIRCRSPPERVEPFSPHHRLVALRQFPDELVAPGGPCGGVDLLVRGAPAAQADVLQNGVPEQHHVLEHEGVVLQQRLRVHGGDVDAAQGDPSALNVPEPGRQLAGGGLAAAGGAHQGRHLALFGGKGHVLQHALPLPVGEFHMVEHDVEVFRLAGFHAGLHRLFLDGPHPLDLQLGIEGAAMFCSTSPRDHTAGQRRTGSPRNTGRTALRWPAGPPCQPPWWQAPPAGRPGRSRRTHRWPAPSGWSSAQPPPAAGPALSGRPPAGCRTGCPGWPRCPPGWRRSPPAW